MSQKAIKWGDPITSVSASKLEQFLWVQEINSSSDLVVIKKTLFDCLNKFTKQKGLLTRVFQLLHDISQFSSSSSTMITEEEIQQSIDSIMNILDINSKYNDITVAILQFIDDIKEFPIVINHLNNDEKKLFSILNNIRTVHESTEDIMKIIDSIIINCSNSINNSKLVVPNNDDNNNNNNDKVEEQTVVDVPATAATTAISSITTVECNNHLLLLESKCNKLEQELLLMTQEKAELVELTKTSQQQALLSIDRIDLITKLFHNATKHINGLIEENDELRLQLQENKLNRELNKLNICLSPNDESKQLDNVSKVSDVSESIEMITSPNYNTVADSDNNDNNGNNGNNGNKNNNESKNNNNNNNNNNSNGSNKTYYDGLVSLAEASIVETIGIDEIVGIKYEEIQKYAAAITKLFRNSRLLGCADLLKQSSTSVTAFRLILKELNLLNDSVKLCDVDILMTKLGIHNQVSIYGFTHLLLLVSKKSFHRCKLYSQILQKLLNKMEKYASITDSYHEKHNYYDELPELSSGDESDIAKLYDEEKNNIQILYNSYLPLIPSSVHGITYDKTLLFCKDFEIVPKIMNQVDFTDFYNNIVVELVPPVNGAVETTLSLHQFQQFLLQISFKCKHFRDQITSKPVIRLANLLFYLDNSNGKNVLLLRNRNMKIIKFKNNVVLNAMQDNRENDKQSSKKKIEFQQKLGPSKKIGNFLN